MPVLHNEKHEIFAQEVAKGKTATEAYTLAGYEPSDANCVRLKKDPKVKARIREILGKAATRASVTVEDIVDQLDEDREFARNKIAPSAAVAATMGKAKVLGLIVDRQGGPDGGPQRIVHEIDISRLTPEQLAALASIRLADD